MRSLAVAAVLVGLVATASAERPRLEVVPAKHIQPSVGNVVNSKTIFLNRCTGGCKVSQGFTDSRTNKSAIASNGTLAAFSYGDTSWNAVVNCMKSTMMRFNVTVTDKDPGPTVDHFEVMIGGTPQQLGFSSQVGGIAEGACSAPGVCSKYIPNALVFDFAAVWGNDPNEICAVAAQEIAHTWSLDHVTDASDPMTYNPFSGMRQFKDGVKCGSDCVSGRGPAPFNLPCSGVGTQEHQCMSSGTATQNDVQILTALFGPAGAVAPTLKVTNPTNGSTQMAGFTVMADCTSTDGTVQEVDLSIDGLPKATLTTPPFNFPTSPTLPEGPHKISVLCASSKQAITIVAADVTIGTACVNGACSQGGYICFNGACIAGPDAPGGLGATCTGNATCVSGLCASDGTTSACVIPCDRSTNNCPDGFGCIDDGTMSGGGLCWFGADDSSGCCETGGGSGAGSLLLALGIAATWITRKRRR